MSRSVLLSLLLLLAASFEKANSKNDYRLPDSTKPLEYQILLEPDLEKFTFTGQSTILFEVLSATDTVVLNALNLTIPNEVTITSSKKVDNKPTEVITGKATTFTTLQRVNIECDKTLTKGETYTLVIKFSGILNDQNKGFYRSRYLDKNNNIRWIATTQFEPTSARLAFPSWDEPAYKANFTIQIRHLNSFNAISNMPQKDTKAEARNKTLTTFHTTPKMSSYLVAFVVSDYVRNGNDTFGVWTKPNAINQTQYALENGLEILKQLDEYTGIEYRNYTPKMDQISIKDFSAGAMENWGLVTYRESRLLYDKDTTSASAKQSILTVIAHEFAHQWFGNLVSPLWWKYIWLNEGFATYFQYYISDRVEPDWRLMEVLVVESMQERAFITDATDNTRPINKDVDTPKEISSLFDAIAYQKAGSIIRMMSHILTEKVFQDGIRRYLNAHALDVAESANLLNSLQEAAGNKRWDNAMFPEVMKEWINEPGYPVLTVKKNEQAIEISQKRFTVDHINSSTKWWVPITYVEENNPDFTNTTPVKWLKPSDEKVVLSPSTKTGWVIVNTKQIGFYRVNYDDSNWEQIIKDLKSEKYAKIDPLNRAQLLDDALILAKAGHLNYSLALDLTTYLKQENDYIPWASTFRNLNHLQNMLRTSNHYHIFKLYVNYILNQVTKTVKYEVPSNDTHVHKLLRTNVMKWGCRADAEECVKYAEKVFSAWLKDSASTLDADLKNNILCTGLRSANESTFYKTLTKLRDTILDEDERKTLLLNMGCSESEAILKKFLLQSVEKDSPVDIVDAVQAVVTNNPKGVAIALSVLEEKHENIKKLENAEQKIQSCMQTIGGAISSQEDYIKLSTFLLHDGTKPDVLHSTIMLAAKNIDWINSYRDKIEDWLIDNESMFNSATTVSFALFLVVISVFITRLY